MSNTKVALALCFLAGFFVLSMWLGATLRTQDMYQACREQHWYPVESVHSDGSGGAAILCAGVTPQEVRDMLDDTPSSF